MREYTLIMRVLKGMNGTGKGEQKELSIVRHQPLILNPAMNILPG